MAATIWKFPLPIADDAVVRMPQGARVLTVAMQGYAPCLWAIVDPEAPKVERHFAVRGTGHVLGEVGDFIGTLFPHGGDLIFHVFEATS